MLDGMEFRSQSKRQTKAKIVEIVMQKQSNKVLCSKFIDTEDNKDPENQVSNVTIQRTPVTGDEPKRLSKLSDPVFSEYHHDIAYIFKMFNIYSLVKQEAFSTIEEYLECIQLNFIHLHNKEDNRCMYNST